MLAVNCLRSGALAVQVIYEEGCDASTRKHNRSSWDDFKVKFVGQFDRTALDNEEFIYHFNEEKWTVLVNRKTKKK